jgi:non-specific serine/threonine protein kinase
MKALELELNVEEERQLSEHAIHDPRAHDCYLRAVHEFRVGSEEALGRALEYLQEGLEIVGENALLYAGMALVHFYYVDTLARPVHPTLDQAEQLAWKSLKLDPRSSLSHHLLGRIERYRGTAVSAVRHFEQALRIDPNDNESLLWLGWMYSLFLGKPAAAKPITARLIEVDPLTPLRHVLLTWIDWMEGRYESALAHLDNSLKECPEFRWPLFFKTQLLARTGEAKESLRVVEHTLKQDSSDGVAALCSLFRSALNGDDPGFSRQLTDPMKDLLWNDPEGPFWMAGWSALLGREKEAIDWLERALDRGWINYPLFARDDPFLESIREETRFIKLVERVRPEWEGFEA